MRTAKRQWLEQAKLLQQRAALLGKEFLPQAALAEHGLAEAVAPVLADVASRARARAEEAASLARQRQRAAELSGRFGDLVAHIGAGCDFLEELRQAMEGAEAELSALRACHATTLEVLAQEEKEADAELDALARRFEGWTSDDAAAAAPLTEATAAASAPPRTTPCTVASHRVRRAGAPVAVTAEATLSPPPACGLTDSASEQTPSPVGNVGGRGSGSSRREAAGGSRSGGGEPMGFSGAGGGGGSGGGRGGGSSGGSALHDEVAQLDAYLARLGGAACGWEADDHAAYLRLRTQTLGPASPADAPHAERSHHLEQQQQLIERAAREIPGQNAASVAAHERALSEREAALERRRQLLQQWRAVKQAESLAARTAAAQEVTSTTSRASSQSASRIGCGSRNVGRSEAEEARQRQLDEWRQRKVAEHEAKIEAEAAQKEAARRKAEEARERHARIKEGLAARAMARAAEAAVLRRLAERQKREAAVGAARARQVALLTMQHRDAAETERRKHEAALRAEERVKREERLRELAAAAQPPEVARQLRDPARLLKPTQAAAARKRETAQAQEGATDAKDSRFGSSSLTFKAAGSRASVAWRQGLNAS